MNPYQPGVAPLAAELHGRPTQGVINHLRRAGFWASFLGWISVIFLLLAVALFLLAPSTPNRSVRYPTQDFSESQMDSIDSGLPANVQTGAAVIGGGLVIITIVSLIASIGMVIMLLWFGGSTKTLLHYPSFDQLHRVMIQQRRMWICIGIYCLCSILYLVVGATAILGLLAQIFG